LVCANRHCFDIARSGYVNLLQPQDRRSKQPGDSAKAVAARRRLHDRGFTAPLLAGIAQILAAAPADNILDAGCGEGFYGGNIAKMSGCPATGIDISTPAIDAAARRYPECLWIAANADRFIPFMDGTFSKVMSITARMNAPEFRRVLRDGGRLLVAVAAPEDLIELRGRGRDRVERTVESFAKEFELVERHRVTTAAELDAEAVDDVLHSIYRPMQTQPVIAMRVTFSLDLLLFRASAS
jgi:23S rRNA (guanine745-N1)-methyltransferase